MSRRTLVAALVAAAALGGCGILRRAAEGPAAATSVPYKLSDREAADVRSSFSAAFTDGRTPVFGPIDARRAGDGGILVCGLARIRKPDGREGAMKLFDGRAEFDPFGVLRFEPKRLSGVNGKFLDIYTDCRNAGML